MEKYMVFARTEYDETLEHRGEIDASDAEEASKLAQERYGKDWLEMSLVPVSEIHWAEREEKAEVEVET